MNRRGAEGSEEEMTPRKPGYGKRSGRQGQMVFLCVSAPLRQERLSSASDLPPRLGVSAVNLVSWLLRSHGMTRILCPPNAYRKPFSATPRSSSSVNPNCRAASSYSAVSAVPKSPGHPYSARSASRVAEPPHGGVRPQKQKSRRHLKSVDSLSSVMVPLLFR